MFENCTMDNTGPGYQVLQVTIHESDVVANVIDEKLETVDGKKTVRQTIECFANVIRKA